MSTSILITGGGGCLPGFKRRVKSEIRGIIQRSSGDGRDASVLATDDARSRMETGSGESTGAHATPIIKDDEHLPAVNSTKAARKARQEKVKTVHQRPYESLVGLKAGIKLINSDEDEERNEEKGWNTGLIPWIGGSLAG